jgi:iron complex outermembrane receptor protein
MIVSSITKTVICDDRNISSQRIHILAFYLICFSFFSLSVFSSSTFAQNDIAQNDVLEFQISPQFLNDALVQFSAATGVQFIYTEDGVLNAETSGVSGRKSIIEGLELLLQGTGYLYEFSNTDTVRIFKEESLNEQSLTAESGSENAEPASTTGERERDRETDVDLNPSSARRVITREIVVTARMREEYIQDVPISITAFEAETIEQRSIENVFDLNVLLPNVNISGGATSGGSSGRFIIRGIPGVARYVDGVPQQSLQGALFDILEVERIEVLRGPQGTLFGKNALSGAIQYITRKPAEEFGARIRMTGGRFNRRDLVVNVDIPLSDTVFSKITFASLNRDGYLDTAVPGFTHGNKNNDVFRGQLLWKPADNFDAVLTVKSNSVEQNQQANVLYDVLESHEEVMAYNNAGFIYTDATHAFGQREQYYTSSIYTGLGDVFDSRGATLDVNWRLNDLISLRSITGYRSFEYGNFQDLDASEYAFFEQWVYQEDIEASQEFQVNGSSDAFSWTAGIYLDDYQTDQRNVRWQYEETNPRPRNEISFTRRKDWAIYAEGTYQLTDELGLTLGLRYSEEDFENANYLPAELRPPIGVVSKNVEYGGLVQANSADFHSITPRASLSYKWNDQIMTYLSYSEGFNGGGVNGTPIDGEFLTYDSEVLAQYEVGLHSDMLDERLRLNAAYFYGVWDDIQVSEVLTPAILTTLNAGEAEIEGAEIDFLWIASNNLTLNLSAAWLGTRYTNVGQATTISLGSPFALAPETSYSVGASYDWPALNSGAEVSLRMDYGWLDEHYTINDIRLQKLQPAYGLLSGRLSYTTANGMFDLALYGTNLTDEWYQVGGFSAALGGVDQGVVARPRELGLALGLTF